MTTHLNVTDGQTTLAAMPRVHELKAPGQKATATQLRVYFPAHKYQLTRSLFFSRLAYTHTHHTCSYRAQERKQKTMLCFTSIWYC